MTPVPSPAAFGQLHAPLHAWDAGGAESAQSLTAWVDGRLQAHRQALADLLAVSIPRTPQNTLYFYDLAIEHLSLAGAQAGVLNSVADAKDVRDQAQLEAQGVAMAGAALSLNREVYDALAAMSLDGASAPTRHYVERTLLAYRLAGVDKDRPTRDRLQALHEQATRIALDFSRNIQEGAKTIQATPAELAGLPPDYLARHPAGADGQVTLSTDQPDMQPVMTFAASPALRERMFLAYNTRAYPANRQLLLDLLATRQQIASILGFRSWADLATADQMMGSAANVRVFLAQLNQASRDGAQREHQLVLDFARQRQPGLTAIDIASRGFWYEQFRRSAFDFDSQSVRPYFPYAQVEAGVLSTAAQLFKIEFRPSTAAAWHPAVSVFNVYESGQPIGRFYLDMHPRDGKDKWFSAAPIVTGVRGRALPEAALICNFPGGPPQRPRLNEPPAAEDPGGSANGPGGEPADPGLLQYSDVVTFFHEFGHLMHAILGGHTEWAGLSGFATEGDFIEVPSQMLEEFFRDEKLLQSFARHYQTGEILPAETIRKMKLAGAFGRADWVRSQLYYTTLSLDLHDQAPVHGAESAANSPPRAAGAANSLTREDARNQDRHDQAPVHGAESAANSPSRAAGAANLLTREDARNQDRHEQTPVHGAEDQNPANLDLDAITRRLYQSLQPWTWIEGNRMYASFSHLTGYSSNYYTYAFDKVIALDFFAQFDPADLLGCDAGRRYRQTVLQQGGSKPGRQMVRDFLGRDERFEAFSAWLNEEFSATLPAAVS